MKNIELDINIMGARELGMVRDLLSAYLDAGKNKTKVLQDPISIGFNPNSACVYLVDEDYNTAIEAGGELHDFFSCPECGNEGIEADFDTSSRCCETYYNQVIQ